MCRYVGFSDGTWPGEYKAKAPFGQLPLLFDTEDESFVLAQSGSIVRFIAAKGGLIPDQNAHLADQYYEGVIDFVNEFVKVMFILPEGEMRDNAAKKLDEEIIPATLNRYEGFLAANGTGYLVGDKLSYADIAVFSMLETMEKRGAKLDDKAHANIIKLKEKVLENEGLRKWVESDERPKF